MDTMTPEDRRLLAAKIVAESAETNYAVNGYYDCDHCSIAEPYGAMYSFNGGAVCGDCAEILELPNYPH